MSNREELLVISALWPTKHAICSSDVNNGLTATAAITGVNRNKFKCLARTLLNGLPAPIVLMTAKLSS